MNHSLYVRQVTLRGEIPREDYIRQLPVVRHLCHKEISFRKSVTFFVGENGTGKSTLIEAIAIAMGFNPEGGTRNFCFSTNNSHSDLSDYLDISKGLPPQDGFFLRSESFYNVATNIDQIHVINNYGGVSLHEQSHGESFMALVDNRFAGNGLYILDEPEAALSPSRIMRLMCNMNELVKKQSQFIISTHSPILMAFPDADIYQLTDSGIEQMPYQQTAHYQITKQFLDDPDRLLHVLLGEE